jgi:hypothetical protein
MVNFCQYKNTLGEIGQGVHGIRLFDIAIIDVVMTCAGSWLIQQGIGKLNIKINYMTVLILAFLSGIVLHRLFCVRTTVDRLIF